jgi:hypothetical protein
MEAQLILFLKNINEEQGILMLLPGKKCLEIQSG